MKYPLAATKRRQAEIPTTHLALAADRVPPYSREAEQAVLGAMMLERSAALDISALLTPEHFHVEAHADIFRAMTALVSHAQPVDILTVNAELRKSGKLNDVGGSFYLSELNRLTPSAANAPFHARIVIEAAMKREIIAQAHAMLSSAYDPQSNAFDVVDAAGGAINRIVERRITKGPRHISAVLKDVQEEVARLSSLRPGEIPGIPTGIYDFDRKTGGLIPTNLHVWAARPGMGKTGFLATAAQYAAAQGVPTGIISLEMSDVQLIARAVADRASVTALKFRDGGFEGRDVEDIARAAAAAATLPLYIDDTPALTLDQIRTRARLLHRREKIKLLFVDYLQLVAGDGSEGTKAAEVTAIARGLKNLAKELNIPVVALAQVNRALEGRADRRPQLSDLKESGGIEEAADQVMFIHRPEYYGITIDEEGLSTAGIAELIIKKQRNGPLGTVRCRFVAEYVRFEDAWRGAEAKIQAPWEQGREF